MADPDNKKTNIVAAFLRKPTKNLNIDAVPIYQVNCGTQSAQKPWLGSQKQSQTQDVITANCEYATNSRTMQRHRQQL